MRKNILAWSVMALAGFLLVWASQHGGASATAGVSQAASDPLSLLPASAVAGFVVDGTDKHQPAISETAAWKSLEETGFRARVFDLLQAVAGMAGPDLGREARGLLEHVMHHGLSGAISQPELNEGLQVYSVLVLHGAAEYAETIGGVLNRALGERVVLQQIDGRAVSQLPLGPQGLEFSWWTESDHLVLAVGTDAVAKVLATAGSGGQDIRKNARYVALRDSDVFTVDSLAWFDAATLIDQFGGMPFPEPPQSGPISIRDFLAMLGLANLNDLTIQTGYSGAECWSRAAINVDGEMSGLLALLKRREMTLDDLPALPPDTTGFFATTFDPSQCYTDVMKVVNRFAEMAGERAQEDIAEFEAETARVLGGDLRTALLDGFGDVWCVYSDPTGMPIPIGFAPVVCFSVKDRDKLLNALDRFLPMLEREMRGGEVSINRSWKDGDLYLSLGIAGAPIVPTIVMTEDWVVASLVPGAAQGFLLRQKGELDSWAPDARVAEALDELPKRFTSISVSDPAPAYTQILNFAPMAMTLFETQVAPNLPAEQRIQLPFGIQDLPVAQRVVAPMFPNVAVSTSTAGGVETWSRYSVPTNPMGNIGSSATLPVLIALLLPAVQQAREAARRTQSKNNLKQLALAMHNYHDTYRKFPRGTFQNAGLEVDERLSWVYGILPFMEQQALYQAVDKTSGWQSDTNEPLSETTIPVLQNPSQPMVWPGVTHYVGIAGVGEDAASLPNNDRNSGIFGYDRETRFADITDGSSNTLMIGDASEPGVSWLAGGQPTIRGFSQSPYLNGPDGIGSPHSGVVQFAFADGSVRAISVEVDESVLKALATKAGGEVIGEF